MIEKRKKEIFTAMTNKIREMFRNIFIRRSKF
jgi:hypothetical protein